MRIARARAIVSPDPGHHLLNPHDFHAPQPFYTKDDLLKWGKGNYFGPGNAQLPSPPMLMMDRITDISLSGGEYGKGHVIGELDIAPHPFIFRLPLLTDDALMPASLGLDAMWQMIGYWLGWSGSPGKGRCDRHRRSENQRAGHTGNQARALRGQYASGEARQTGSRNCRPPRVCADDACVYLARDMRVGLTKAAT